MFWWGKRKTYQVRHRWEDNIKISLQEILWFGVEWVNLAQDWDKWWKSLNIWERL